MEATCERSAGGIKKRAKFVLDEKCDREPYTGHRCGTLLPSIPLNSPPLDGCNSESFPSRGECERYKKFCAYDPFPVEGLPLDESLN